MATTNTYIHIKNKDSIRISKLHSELITIEIEGRNNVTLFMKDSNLLELANALNTYISNSQMKEATFSL